MDWFGMVTEEQTLVHLKYKMKSDTLDSYER